MHASKYGHMVGVAEVGVFVRGGGGVSGNKWRGVE